MTALKVLGFVAATLIAGPFFLVPWVLYMLFRKKPDTDAPVQTEVPIIKE